MMRLLLSIFTIFAVHTSLITAAADDNVKNCPFGLTANEIAASSGVDLTGKTALVTGGRSGLGYAISEALLRQNCTVIIASRKDELNRQAVASLKTTVPGADVSYLVFDLEDFESVKTLASTLSSSNLTSLDYYFGSAGQGGFEVAAQPLTVDGYERLFQVNYLAQVLLLELLLPLLRESQPSRIMLTGSSSHSLACGTLGLAKEGDPEDLCFADDGKAMSMLPLNQAGLDKVNSTFSCPVLPPLAGSYSLTKFLHIQLAKEIAQREKNAGNQVYVYTWAPGNIRTGLNPWAICCLAQFESFGATCRFQLPYVGPEDEDGNPEKPSNVSFWISPAHGTMSALYSALHATPEQTGSYFPTYWKCEPDAGLFLQGMTEKGRDLLYRKSLFWAGLADFVDSDVGPEDSAEELDEISAAGMATVSWSLLLSMFVVALLAEGQPRR